MLLLHHLLDPVDVVAVGTYVMCVLQSVYEESKEGTRNAWPQNQVEQNECYYPHYDPAHEPNLLGGNTGLLGIAVLTHTIGVGLVPHACLTGRGCCCMGAP